MYDQIKINNDIYIELDSTYRNRTIYPNQSTFITNVGCPSSGNTGIDAIDPVLSGFPSHKIHIDDRNFLYEESFSGGTPSVPKLGGPVSDIDDFYKGMTLKNITTNEETIIDKYDGLSKFTTLHFPFSNNWSSENKFNIISTTSNQVIYDPNGDNIHVGKYIYNPLLDEGSNFKKIIMFDPLTMTYLLESPFNAVPSQTDILEVRSSGYMIKGKGNIQGNHLSMTNPQSSFVGNFIRITSGDEGVVYNGQYYVSTNDYWCIDGGQMTPSHNVTFSLNNDRMIYYSNDKHAWMDNVFTTYVANDPILEEEAIMITSENVLRSSGIFPKMEYKTMKDSLKLITAIDDTGVIFKPAVNINKEVDYEILQYSYDNIGYLDVYSTSQGLYEVELIDLVIPNVILDNELGSRIAFYPFVYVQFNNPNNKTKRLLHTNNPNISSVVFKCPVYDINTPSMSKYVKLDSNGMKQTIQFNTTSPIEFSVFFPDGSILQTQEKDTLPPSVPNHNLQISALFRLSKVC